MHIHLDYMRLNNVNSRIEILTKNEYVRVHGWLGAWLHAAYPEADAWAQGSAPIASVYCCTLSKVVEVPFLGKWRASFLLVVMVYLA